MQTQPTTTRSESVITNVDDVNTADIDDVRELIRAADDNELAVLRARVATLEHQLKSLIDDPEEAAQFVAGALPLAVTKSSSDNGDLSMSLEKVVTKSLYGDSRKDSDAVAEALFPVMGRATRMIIANLFSPTSKGKHAYEVEEIFLIERVSGIPMTHLSFVGEESTDSDVVSGMLEAIRSFVQDSFNAKDHDGMRELNVGDISVLVEWGPHAILAAVLRGTAPPHFQLEMQAILERLHLDYAHDLINYDGNPENMVVVHPTLKGLTDPKTRQFGAEERNEIFVTLIIMTLLVLTGLFAIWISG